MPTLLRKPTQKDRVKRALEAASDGYDFGEYGKPGGWLSKRFMVQVMKLSQAGARIYELNEEVEVESSTFKDQYGFCYYRLKTCPAQTQE